jgi:hypothetical protein
LVLLLVGILDFYDVARCLFGGVGLVGLAAHLAGAPCTLQTGWKRKKKFSKALELFRANWKNLMRWTSDARGCAGRRWTLGTALDRRRLARTAAALLDGSA